MHFFGIKIYGFRLNSVIFAHKYPIDNIPALIQMKYPIDNIPALIQMMACRMFADKPLFQPMVAWFTDA